MYCISCAGQKHQHIYILMFKLSRSNINQIMDSCTVSANQAECLYYTKLKSTLRQDHTTENSSPYQSNLLASISAAVQKKKYTNPQDLSKFGDNQLYNGIEEQRAKNSMFRSADEAYIYIMGQNLYLDQQPCNSQTKNIGIA